MLAGKLESMCPGLNPVVQLDLRRTKVDGCNQIPNLCSDEGIDGQILSSKEVVPHFLQSGPM
jgi:hypothetical protein